MRHSPSTAKILLPSLPVVLDRPRLMERLHQHRDKKLMVILGQAAQGKSTLAAAYVSASNIPTAWINLGTDDSDAVNLFQVLVQSLQQTVKNVDLSAVFNYPAVSMGPREAVFLHKDWVQALMEPMTDPLQIVLDGLDRLSPDASSFGLLQVLVDHVPQNVQVIMLSREMPPLNVQSRKMRREAYLMTNEELAFTPEEVKFFFRKLQKMVLAADELKKIHQVTEGWVGGLILLAESLSSMAGELREVHVLPELPDRFSEGAFRYFAEEIFAFQTPEIQEFLIKSSILETIEPDFVKELLGTADAGKILQRGAERNLFIHSFYDNKRGWLFKYHQLFRDFLLTKLKMELPEEATQSLFLKAGLLHENRGHLEHAVECYLKAGDYTRAESVLQEIGMDLLNKGRTGDLGRCLEGLPREVLQENPWLLYYHHMTGRFLGSHEYLLNLMRAFELFQEQNNTRGLLLSLASLIESSIARGHPSIPPTHSLIAQAETLLGSVPLNQYPGERAMLWLQIGFAHLMKINAPLKGYMSSDQAYLLARDLGNVPVQVNALILAHRALSCLGEFARAAKIIQKVEKLLDTCLYPEAYALHLIHCVLHYSFQGALEQADVALQTARKVIEDHGLTYLYLPYMMNEIWMKQRHGKYDEAEEEGNRLVNLALAMGNSFIHVGALMHWGMVSYCRGDFPKAKELLERGREVASSEELGLDYHMALFKILLSLTACHLNEDGSAEDGLEELVSHLQETSNRLLLMEALLTRALCKWRVGKLDDAATDLGAGIKIMREQANDQWIFLNHEDMLQLCTLALELQVEGAVEYAAHLLSTRLAAMAGPELERLSQRACGQVAEKAVEIRRVIHRSNLPPLRIQTLGAFRVLRGATPVEAKEWQAIQPQLFLKALISRGSRRVPKELILEDLWPEIPFDAAERNFKVILHRLRKVLEPRMDRDFGSSYVHLKANLLSLDDELCRVDVDQFVFFIDQGKKSEIDGETKQALSCYEEAMKIYGGDFLPEELYRSWADWKREELQSKYMDLLLGMAELYEKQRGTTRKAIEICRRIIRMDALQEPAYQRLMVLYSNRGMRNTALKIYDDCREALEKGLQSKPDDLTTSIYKRILASQ